MDSGVLPDFLPETAAVRAGDWSIASIPADLADRRFQVIGPVDRKSVINALNVVQKLSAVLSTLPPLMRNRFSYVIDEILEQMQNDGMSKAAADKARAGKGQPGAGPAPGSEAGPQPEGGSKDEGPIIDAEVVDEKKG